MYITCLKLEDIKCFKKLEYKFKGQKGDSLVIAGDNGGHTNLFTQLELFLHRVVQVLATSTPPSFAIPRALFLSSVQQTETDFMNVSDPGPARGYIR